MVSLALVIAIDLFNVSLFTIIVDVMDAVKTLLIVVICVTWHLVTIFIDFIFIEIDWSSPIDIMTALMTRLIA